MSRVRQKTDSTMRAQCAAGAVCLLAVQFGRRYACVPVREKYKRSCLIGNGIKLYQADQDKLGFIMKKKIISVLAVLAMLVFACGTAFSADFSIDLKSIKDTIKKDVKNAKSGSTTGTAKTAPAYNEPNSEDDFDWKVNDDFTEITITKYKGERKNVVIPATIQDVPITCIGVEAFKYANITSVIIPECVKKILGSAFYGSDIQSIEIPKGCTLTSEAFKDCDELESVILPEGLKIIPYACFSGCKKLANVNFPSTLKLIGESAFRDCPFTSVDIPEGVECIHQFAFVSNTIISISLPKSLKWVVLNGSTLPIIQSDNISTITIAEGCSPTVIFHGRSEDVIDSRNLIKGTSIDKSLKLQKQLAAWKLPYTPHLSTVISERYSQYKKNGTFIKKGVKQYYTEIGKAFYNDMIKYGFTEEAANNLVGYYIRG